MNHGLNPSDLVSRIEADVHFDSKLVEFVDQSARWFTNGAVELEGAEIPQVWEAQGKCAYLIGGMLGWARISGAEIPEEMVPFLRDVQAAYREGLINRYADQEAAGAEAARVALE